MQDTFRLVSLFYGWKLKPAKCWLILQIYPITSLANQVFRMTQLFKTSRTQPFWILKLNSSLSFYWTNLQNSNINWNVLTTHTLLALIKTQRSRYRWKLTSALGFLLMGFHLRWKHFVFHKFQKHFLWNFNM